MYRNTQEQYFTSEDEIKIIWYHKKIVKTLKL